MKTAEEAYAKWERDMESVVEDFTGTLEFDERAALYDREQRLMAAARAEALASPIPMLLWCPVCHLQHIDEPSPTWANPPHRTHLCLGCGHLWRPAEVATNGVLALAEKGAAP